ncbi:hypothetical protein Btru_027673 [Bulinus truncatus]|nr:hypothetical protein Btru_027673 [Bulinus truncatus]
MGLTLTQFVMMGLTLTQFVKMGLTLPQFVMMGLALTQFVLFCNIYYLTALQSRSDGENSRLIDLTVSVTGQKSVVDKFYKLDFKQLQLDQNKINKRLDALDETPGPKFGQCCGHCKIKVQDELISHVGQLLNSSEELQADDIKRENTIQELTLKVQVVETRTDSLFISDVRLRDNLNRIVRDVQQVMIRINSVTAIEEQVDIELLKSGTVSTVARPINIPLTRAPRSSPSSIVGFSVSRNKNQTSEYSNATNIISISSQIIRQGINVFVRLYSRGLHYNWSLTMYSTVAIVLCVFGVCTAQYNNQAYSANQANYNNYGNVEAELNILKNQIAALGNRFEGQNNRINDLTLSVAAQKDAINKFYKLDLVQIELDQVKVGNRLDALAKQINAINYLRNEVKDIADEAAALKNTVENVYIPQDEKLLADAEQLKTKDVERQALIDELTLKELNVEGRADALFVSATNTASEQQKLERDIRYVIIRLNNVTAVSASATVVLNQGQGSASVAINPKFTRVPLSAPSSVVGFKAVRSKSYAPYSYYPEVETVGFSSKVTFEDNAVFEAKDKSQGGWSVQSVDAQTVAQ